MFNGPVHHELAVGDAVLCLKRDIDSPVTHTHRGDVCRHGAPRPRLVNGTEHPLPRLIRSEPAKQSCGFCRSRSRPSPAAPRLVSPARRPQAGSPRPGWRRAPPRPRLAWGRTEEASGLWRSERSPNVLARPARGTSTAARASELQQAPAPGPAATVPTHKVTVHDRERGVVHQFVVPQDQYILHTAEAHAPIRLPPCCAVRIKSGQIRQPEALRISADLREQGYALLCVGYPSSDLEVETQDEDEVYWLQFGRYFARGPVDRDDYALELAMGDE